MTSLEIITIGLLLLVVALYVCDRMVAAWERFAAWFAWWSDVEARREFDRTCRRLQSPRSLP